MVDHRPRTQEVIKFGTMDYQAIRAVKRNLEDCMMSVNASREQQNFIYTQEEISGHVVDEYRAEVDKTGTVTFHVCRVRIFVLAFLSDMPDVEVGINDRERQGKEIVGRHDIIPIKTEEWIRLIDQEFHPAIRVQDFEKNGNLLKFEPLDGALFEIMRFRVRLPKKRELPLIIRCTTTFVARTRVEVRCEVTVPGYFSNSKRHGQVPCDNIQIRIPLPECWIYKFRVEKRFKYGSVHSAHRKAGKVKGVERVIGMTSALNDQLMETSCGDAKYEHIFRSVVWRIERLPQRGEGAYKTHVFSCGFDVGAHDEWPDAFEDHFFVEYTQPSTTQSKTQIRSISVSPQPDPFPEKWVKLMTKAEYRCEMNYDTREPVKMGKDGLPPTP